MGDLDAHWRRFVERNLLVLQRAFEAGNEAALYDAARFCLHNQSVAAPAWVLRALIERQADHMKRLSRGKGRHARWMTAFRQDQVDYARYDALLEAKERKDELGLSWKDDGIYEAVAAVLKGSPAHGNSRQIKESYLSVRRRIKTEPWRYVRFRGIPGTE